MANITILNDSKNRIGGGYTFIRNMVDNGFTVNDYSADAFLLPSSSVVVPETLSKARKKGKVILRIDGYPEDWRNEGRGIARLINAYQNADLVIYQSFFSMETVGRFLSKQVGYRDWQVIYNGVPDIFSRYGEKLKKDAYRVIVVNFYRKDPNKRYEEVIARYRAEWQYTNDVSLWIIGRIPTEYMQYNYGFFNGERYKAFGVLKENKDIARVLRSADEMWYPSFADPCPNSVLEALASGLPVKHTSDYGGVREIVDEFGENPEKFKIDTMIESYKHHIENTLV